MLKNAKVNGVWITVELTQEEKEKVLDELLIENAHHLRNCILKANELWKETPVADVLRRRNITKMLYDKQATASYSALSQALDRKVFQMKNKDYEPPQKVSPEQQDKIDKAIEEGTKKEEKPNKDPSVIEQYFNKDEQL